MEEDNSDAEFFAQSRRRKAKREKKRKRGRPPPNALKSDASLREFPEEVLSKGKTRKTHTQKGAAAAAAAAAAAGAGVRTSRTGYRKTATDLLAPSAQRKKSLKSASSSIRDPFLNKHAAPMTIMVTTKELATGHTQNFTSLRRCGEALGINPGTISRALKYEVGLNRATNETRGFAFTRTVIPADDQQPGEDAAAAASSAAAAASAYPTQRRVARGRRGRGAIDSLALAAVSTTRMPKVATRGRGGKGLGGRGRRRGRGGWGRRGRMSSAKPREASVMEEEEEDDEGEDLEEQEAAEGSQSDAADNVMDPAGWMDAADEGGEGDWENMGDDYSHYHPSPRVTPPGYFRDHPMHTHRGFGPSYCPPAHRYPPYNQLPYHPPTSTSNDNPYQQQQGHRDGYTNNNNTAGGRGAAPNPMFRPRFLHWAYSYRPPHSNMYSPPPPPGYRAYPPGSQQPPWEEGQHQRGGAQSQKRADRQGDGLSPPPDERQTQRRDPHRPEPGHFPMPGPWGDRPHAGRMMSTYSYRGGAAAAPAAAAAPGAPPMRPRAGSHAPFSFWSPYQQTFPPGPFPPPVLPLSSPVTYRETADEEGEDESDVSEPNSQVKEMIRTAEREAAQARAAEEGEREEEAEEEKEEEEAEEKEEAAEEEKEEAAEEEKEEEAEEARSGTGRGEESGEEEGEDLRPAREGAVKGPKWAGNFLTYEDDE
uniref:Nuclease-associated modular DNA-binding 1 domain-containing protein n=1 Tax=Chromera velia CCMP2878 TaxID=1169474 RepID=A0A0G4G167_9ALVE|eukprot:Cvel_4040.t1-p1 / transcript=Cvel_4040.t1 / gene=Cvel_4040 / organism=Chromera_velia_CCMP2878 / gene_product=hypothetical protein / transcript_product=hypothetical protein / location=Cvel_scaffold172:2237-7664(-) / protein_length=703 / sequence_SO=supercontig / SO=protein_coding / is_pseudo=false